MCRGLVALSQCPAPQDRVSLRKMGSESFLIMLRYLPALQPFALSQCLHWVVAAGAVPGAVPALPQPHQELPAAQHRPRHLQLFPSGIISLIIKGWLGLNVIQEKYFRAKNSLLLFASLPEQTPACGPVTHISSFTSCNTHYTKLYVKPNSCYLGWTRVLNWKQNRARNHHQPWKTSKALASAQEGQIHEPILSRTQVPA